MFVFPARMFHVPLPRSEIEVIDLLSWLMIVSGTSTGFLLLCTRFKAPYGRYGHESIFAKITLPAKFCWFLQELPCLVIPAYYFINGGLCYEFNQGSLVLILFTIHYIQRCLIFPFLIRGGKPFPIHTVLMGMIFTCWNSYMQSAYHCNLIKYTNLDSLTVLADVSGVLLFSFGMAVNVHSDHILRTLRKPGETGYKIPHGGMFAYVSGANFFGEIVEWFGYALVARSLPALAFALFTLSNIGPRAWQHHDWYRKKFDNYPSSRKALIPFIL